MRIGHELVIMATIINRTKPGDRFGKLVTIRKDETNTTKTIKWICRCDCGNEKIVDGYALRSGKSRSCGCLRAEINSLPKGEGAFNRLYSSYSKRAKERNLEWLLSKDNVREITKQNCYYCGIEPRQYGYRKKHENGGFGGNGSYIYNGIDRIDSSKGYTLDNVLPCCGKCNMAKSVMDINEFKKWIIKVYNNFQLDSDTD